ncbi:MAG: hypothetical protein NTU63_03640 [Candidatus Pacearchaeota archaeon]|nr:hypothetical protein [Candidatus Pacearchaeota archaeon]
MVSSETVTGIISFALIITTCIVLLEMFKGDEAMRIVVLIVSVFSVFLVVFWIIGKKSGLTK